MDAKHVSLSLSLFVCYMYIPLPWYAQLIYMHYLLHRRSKDLYDISLSVIFMNCYKKYISGKFESLAVLCMFTRVAVYMFVHIFLTVIYN